MADVQTRKIRACSPHVGFGSVADEVQATASRPLHPTLRTNAEASLNICVGRGARIKPFDGQIIPGIFRLWPPPVRGALRDFFAAARWLLLRA